MACTPPRHRGPASAGIAATTTGLATVASAAARAAARAMCDEDGRQYEHGTKARWPARRHWRAPERRGLAVPELSLRSRLARNHPRRSVLTALLRGEDHHAEDFLDAISEVEKKHEAAQILGHFQPEPRSAGHAKTMPIKMSSEGTTPLVETQIGRYEMPNSSHGNGSSGDVKMFEPIDEEAAMSP